MKIRFMFAGVLAPAALFLSGAFVCPVFTPGPAVATGSEGNCKIGTSFGDPHIRTGDGVRYSFQTAGEYTLLESGRDFRVQVRQEFWPGRRDFSVNTAVAVQAGRDVLVIDKDRTMYLNSRRLTDIPEATQGFLLHSEKGRLHIVTRDAGYGITLAFGRGFINTRVSVCGRNLNRDKTRGLLGNFNGNASDDLEIGNNRIRRRDLKQHYNAFARAWQVSMEDSLFQRQGIGIVRLGLPTNIPTGRVDTDLRNQPLAVSTETARQRCEDAGVPDFELAACIMDVAITGNNSFATAAASILLAPVKMVLKRIKKLRKKAVKGVKGGAKILFDTLFD